MAVAGLLLLNKFYCNISTLLRELLVKLFHFHFCLFFQILHNIYGRQQIYQLVRIVKLVKLMNL